jgi:hypothetical protein
MARSHTSLDAIDAAAAAEAAGFALATLLGVG